MTQFVTSPPDRPEPAARPARADSVRNLRRILEAAEEVFASQGVAAPIDEVARRAGVGVGTVYRHFPTKKALVKAVVAERIEGFLNQTERYVDMGGAEGFFTFLTDMVTLAGRSRDLAEELGNSDDEHTENKAAMLARLNQVLGGLLAGAQDDGVVRRDVTVDDVLSLAGCLCASAPLPGADTDKILSVVFAGLRSDS